MQPVTPVILRGGSTESSCRARPQPRPRGGLAWRPAAGAGRRLADLLAGKARKTKVRELQRRAVGREEDVACVDADAACPISTGGGTRRVRSVRGAGGGGVVARGDVAVDDGVRAVVQKVQRLRELLAPGRR
jgi:hypothetical protein